MKTRRIFHPLFLLVLMAVAGGFSEISAQNNYKHSVGGCAGSITGISLKFNLKDNVYLQTDWGVSLSTNLLCPVINELYICPNLGGQLNILYEKKFRNATNTFWIIGGGVCGAKDLAKGITSPYWKTGVRLVWGIEWCFDFPLSIQLDTRQGYGLFFSSDKNFDGSENPLFFTFGHVPFHFYDFSLVFSVRYCFGKNDKNNQ